MESISVKTKLGIKRFKLTGDQNVCYNCEKISEDCYPTDDSSINFCKDCHEDYYCLKCGKQLENGETAYHKKCKPNEVNLI